MLSGSRKEDSQTLISTESVCIRGHWRMKRVNGDPTLGVRGVGSSNLPVPTILKINNLLDAATGAIASGRNASMRHYGENL
jgi:hypothetical protein